MAEQIQFELVTPEKLLIDKAVAHVVLPGEAGDLGVLPEHAPLIANLRPGLIEVFEQESGAAERLFVKRGFAQVTAERLVVLAEDCIDPESADVAEVDQRIRDAEEDLADAGEDALERRKAEAELAWLRPLRDLLSG